MKLKRANLYVSLILVLTLLCSGCGTDNSEGVTISDYDSPQNSVSALEAISVDDTAIADNNGKPYNTNERTEYNAIIHDSKYVSITLVAIYLDHIEFTVESKMNNNNITVFLETVSLDGLVPPTTYSDTWCQDLSPGETLTFVINASLNFTEHKYLSAYFSVFDDTGTSAEDISITNFDLGGSEHLEFEEPNEKLAYDSSSLSVYYVGAENDGIHLRAKNKLDQSVYFYIDVPFLINGEKVGAYGNALPIPPYSTSDYYVNVKEFDADYSPDDFTSFSCTGSTNWGVTIDEFSISSDSEAVPSYNSNYGEDPTTTSVSSSPDAVCIAEQTYQDAIHATKSDLTGTKGNYYYNGIPLLSKDCEWIDNPININGTVSQGVIYRKIAYMLWASDFEKKRFLYSYKDISELLLGFIPDTVDDYIPLAQNASNFIVTDDQLSAIMLEFQSLDCVSGVFDYDYGKFGKFSVDITDTTICAEKMGISEEMLGYVFAMLDEYGPTITFEGKRCQIEYESPV